MQKARPYDTIVLDPGLYKQRILCTIPLKFIAKVLHASPRCVPPMLLSESHCLTASRYSCATTSPQNGALPLEGAGDDGADGAEAWPSGPPPLPPPLTSAAVTFWQERPPVVLCNCDTICLAGMTIRVAHASHEYSSIAYGSEGRAITMEACHVMGGTGLRIPYAIDPLQVLLLSLRSCVIEVLPSLCVLPLPSQATDALVCPSLWPPTTDQKVCEVTL
jgi:hypothetical protein